MANSLTAFNPEYWSKRMQVLLRKSLISKEIANTEERSGMSDGDVVHRVYHSDPYVADYTKGTDVTIQDITATDESLSVNQSKVVPVYVDQVDITQNKYETANSLIDRSSHMLSRDIDAAVLSEVENASYDIDDGDISGTSGNAIALTTSNSVNTFGTTNAELASNNVENDKNWYLAIDPHTANIIMQTFVSSGFQTADLSLRNGFLGDWLGFKVFQSNNVLHSVSLGIATNPTASDTFTINGVTFTFVASPSSAGDIDIGANAAATVDNIVLAINGTGTAGSSTYIELSAANRAKLKNAQVSATDNTTAVGITASGRMILSETLTDGTDNFGVQTSKCFAGRMGAVDLVVQSEPTVYVKDEPKKLGKNYLSHTLYGVKTFQEGQDRSIEINIQATAAT